MDTTSLVIIDALNLLRRVFEANPDEDSAEKAEKACVSAMSTFRRALYGAEDFKPTHGVAVFDAEGSNWRHALYPQYKTGRKPMSAHLRAALPAFQAQLKSELGLHSLTLDGVEADDVIGTLIRRWTQAGGASRGRVVVSTTDKDLYEYASIGVEFRDVFKREWTTLDKIQEKIHGLSPELIRDYLALTGDSTDGVPGVPKVGPKTAAAYLAEYGSLEAVLRAACDGLLKGKVGESVKTYCEQARLSRQLVALKTDLTLGITWRTLQLR